MFSLFSWAAIKIRSFVFKVQKNLSSRCLCFPDCNLLLSFLFFLSFYALINHSLDSHAVSRLRQFFCDVTFEDLGFSQGLPIFGCRSQRHLSVDVQMLMNDSEVCSVTENSKILISYTTTVLHLLAGHFPSFYLFTILPAPIVTGFHEQTGK